MLVWEVELIYDEYLEECEHKGIAPLPMEEWWADLEA